MSAIPTIEELLSLDPRREHDLLRHLLLLRTEAGAPCQDAIAALAERDPVALAELLIGPRADPRLLPLALVAADALERALSPAAVYRRLVDLCAEADQPEELGLQVLELAVARHPDARWLVPLSARVEGPLAGITHLLAHAGSDDFGALCLLYARAGARQSLVEAATATARPEPLGALARVGDREALVDAATAVFRAMPDLPLVAWLAAAWGPDPMPLVDGVAARVGAEAAQGLFVLGWRP